MTASSRPVSTLRVILLWLVVAPSALILRYGTLVAYGGDTKAPAKWSDSPCAKIPIQPSVDVREFVIDGRPKVAIAVSFHCLGSVEQLFNPFGVGEYGRPYSVVLSDLEMKRTWPILATTEARYSIPASKAWVPVYQGGVVGRVFWLGEPSTNARLQVDNNNCLMPGILSGDYLLHVVATKRLGTRPPFSDFEQIRTNEQKAWQLPDQDEAAFRSQPVPVTVMPDGTLRPTATLRQALEEVEVTAQLDTQGDQELLVAIWSRQARSFHEPFMFDAIQPTRPLQIQIANDIGKQVYDHNSGLKIGHSVISSIDGCVNVPIDGIVGSSIRLNTPLPPGQYKLRAEVTEIIDREWLFAPMDPFQSTKTSRVPSVLFQNRRGVLSVRDVDFPKPR